MQEFNVEDYFKVGWVKEPHGLKGEIYVKLLSKNPEWLEGFTEFVLSSSEGSALYAIKRWRPHKQGIIVHPAEVTNRNESELLKGHEFLIPRALLTSEEGEQPYLIEFMGFEVIDKTLGSVGKVVGFADNGAQDLLEVSTEKGKALIPFVDAFVVEIDKEKAEINMDLPEGLLE